jgi:hypothetical protein
MRRVSWAIAALATMLAFVPSSALCDSFGYKISSPKIGADTNFGAGRSKVPGGIAESGIFASSEVSGNSGSSLGGAFGRGAADRQIDGAFFFDNLLQSENSQAGGGGKTGALVDLNGRDVVLLSGYFGGGASRGDKGGQFVYADKGNYQVSNELQKGNGAARNSATALTVTPEPGSLFLLGTGLLGLALVLFWKAAKRSAGS